jgi:hypothetical protein
MTKVEEFRRRMGFKEPWIGVDLDGVLATNNLKDLYFSYSHIGPPIMPMVRRVKRWLRQGKTVKIFTARVEGGKDAINYIQIWLMDYAGLPMLEVTNIKDSGMVEIWDDLAVNVPINSGKPKGYYKNWKVRRT